MHGRGHAWQGVCVAGGVCGRVRGHVWQGAFMVGGEGGAWVAGDGGGHGWQGVCMAGGMHGGGVHGRGHAWQERWLLQRMVCHPIGILSCLLNINSLRRRPVSEKNLVKYEIFRRDLYNTLCKQKKIF